MSGLSRCPRYPGRERLGLPRGVDLQAHGRRLARARADARRWPEHLRDSRRALKVSRPSRSVRWAECRPPHACPTELPAMAGRDVDDLDAPVDAVLGTRRIEQLLLAEAFGGQVSGLDAVLADQILPHRF